MARGRSPRAGTSAAIPTFFLIDHRGVIRSKNDIHPFDTPAFEKAIEALLKETEADGPRH